MMVHIYHTTLCSVENKLIYLKWIYGRYCLASQILWHLITSPLSLSLSSPLHSSYRSSTSLSFSLSLSFSHKMHSCTTHKKRRRGDISRNSALYRFFIFSSASLHAMSKTFDLISIVIYTRVPGKNLYCFFK